MDALRDRTQVQIESDVAETHEASKRAADFLSTQIGAPNAKSLPYVNQFAVLAEVFRRLPGPTSDQYAAIRRWFWRTTLTSYFGGWNTGQMAIDRQAIISFAAGDTSEIENSSVVPTQSIWSDREFRANSATSKMLALMLSHTCPVDLVTGQTIDVAKSLTWSNDKEYHHFFPKKHLAGTGVPTRRANVVANIVMLTSISNIQISASAPSVYLTKIAKEVGETELRRRLETSLVRAEAYAAALDDDYPAFIAARSATLQARAMELVGSVGTSPGLGTLTATDESIVDDADGDLE